MSAYDPARWSDFALVQLGASAALLGLVFVGLSINLRDVVGSRQLVNRAAEAVIGLAAVLVTATAVLIPDQSRGVVSAELLVIAVFTFAVTVRLQRASDPSKTAMSISTASPARTVTGLSTGKNAQE